MAYKVVITKEVDEALDCIDEYCIEHFHNYEFAKKVFNEIIKVASFFSENVGKTKKYSKFLYKYVSPDIGYNIYYSADQINKIVYIEKFFHLKKTSYKLYKIKELQIFAKLR